MHSSISLVSSPANLKSPPQCWQAQWLTKCLCSSRGRWNGKNFVYGLRFYRFEKLSLRLWRYITSSIDNCAAVNRTWPLCACGQTNTAHHHPTTALWYGHHAYLKTQTDALIMAPHPFVFTPLCQPVTPATSQIRLPVTGWIMITLNCHPLCQTWLNQLYYIKPVGLWVCGQQGCCPYIHNLSLWILWVTTKRGTSEVVIHKSTC